MPNAISREPNIRCYIAKNLFSDTRPALTACSCLYAKAGTYHMAPLLPHTARTFSLHSFVNHFLHFFTLMGLFKQLNPTQNKDSFSCTFWRWKDVQCKRSIKVHHKMSSVPQASVLSVTLRALPTAKTPAAGQNQQHWCQQLVGCHPTVVPERYKAVGIIYCFCKWQKKKGDLCVPCWTPEIEKELDLFYFTFKKQYQTTNVWRRWEIKKILQKFMTYLLSGLFLHLVCIPNIFIYSNQ